MTRISQAGIGFPTDGGMATTRAAATTQDIATREADRADALAYLTRTGNTDLAVILGLAAAPKRTKPPRNTSPRRCAYSQCGIDFLPASGSQLTCSRSCGGKHSAERRRAFANEAGGAR